MSENAARAFVPSVEPRDIETFAKGRPHRYQIEDHWMTGHPVLRHAAGSISVRDETAPCVSLKDLEVMLHWAWAHGWLEAQREEEVKWHSADAAVENIVADDGKLEGV